MQRRNLLTLLPVLLIVLAGPAFATQFDDEVVAQLDAQGFTSITKATTWLGRVHIYAERRDGHREIVINPRTGEILRDIWTGAGGAEASKPILDAVGDGSGKGTTGRDGSGSSDGGSASGGSTGSGSDGGSDGGSTGGTSGGTDDSSGSGSGSHDASGAGNSGGDNAGGDSAGDSSGGDDSGGGHDASGGEGGDSSGKDGGN